MADTTSSELLARSRQPVYLQLATIFRRQIESGAWREGERIPSLEELCRQYGVARMTMHHALSMLDEEGLVARSRGRGTFVKAPCQSRRQVSLSTSWDEAVAVGAQLDTEAMVESAGNVPLPADLGIPCPGERAAEYHFLRRLHRLEGRPFAVGEVYIERGELIVYYARIEFPTDFVCLDFDLLAARPCPA